MTYAVRAGSEIVPIAVGDEFDWRGKNPDTVWRCRVLELAHGPFTARVYGLVLTLDGRDVAGHCFAKWFWRDIERVYPAAVQQPKGT